MQFFAIDVETANADMSSICQIGIAKFDNGLVVDEWSSLINPEDHFDDINIKIHGITENDVKGSPTLPEVEADLISFLSGVTCVCHTHFDRVSIGKALAKYSLDPINISWLDSARVARRTWEDCAWKGYGLSKVCKIIGYEFKHHDALEDAKAAGHIILAASEKTGLTINDWLKRVTQPIDPGNVSMSGSSSINRDGNPEGELFGEVLVFTGALDIPRSQAANLASSVGCSVTAGVTKKTTLLVVGDQDITKFAGKSKSSKHLKAEQLILKGQAIRIISESDFQELVTQAHKII